MIFRTELQRQAFSQNAKKLNQAKRDERKLQEASYMAGPKYCARPDCDKTIPFEKRHNRFCSKSCSAKVANATRSKESREQQRATIRIRYQNQGRYKEAKDLRAYRRQCRFRDFDLRIIEGCQLVKKHGWYDPFANPNGCVMDHMLSVSQGFRDGISPKLLSHPANCQIMLQRDNCSKNSKSSITLDELETRISSWES